uniref:C2H2-type domain-containing protein n=1 Tax=Glossina morsitans morsitans TaxID=37546 RepID=A0A1B0G3P0_GLOMM
MDAKYYCGTCQLQLIDKNENDDNYVNIVEHPQLLDFIAHNITTNQHQYHYDFNLIKNYLPYLCYSCLQKWQDFQNYCLMAIESYENLKKVLHCEKPHKPSTTCEGIQKSGIIAEESLVEANAISKVNHILTSHVNTANALTPSKELPGLREDHLIRNVEEYSIDIEDFREEDVTFQSIVNIKNVSSKSQTRKSGTKIGKELNKLETLQVRNKNKSNKVIAKPPKLSTCRKQKTKIIIRCNLCKKYFYEQHKYEAHQQREHEGVKRPYKCAQCERSYSLQKTLKAHILDNHIEEHQQKSYICDKCFKSFKTSAILKQHCFLQHLTSKEELRIICEQCGLIAANQYSLAQHIKNKHSNDPEQYKCEKCPKTFKSPYTLKIHVFRHHAPEANYKCPECDATYARRFMLHCHMRSHSKYSERFQCEHAGCEVRFVSKGDMRYHMRLVHFKVKKHICDYCGEPFGTLKTLRHHRYIHTGEKPYKCEICGQSFRQPTAMKTHRKIHLANVLKV